MPAPIPTDNSSDRLDSIHSAADAGRAYALNPSAVHPSNLTPAITADQHLPSLFNDIPQPEQAVIIAGLLGPNSAARREDVPQTERQSIIDLFEAEYEAPWVRTLRNSNDADAVLEQAGPGNTRVMQAVDAIQETGQGAAVLLEVFQDADRDARALQNPSSEKRLLFMLRNYRAFLHLARQHIPNAPAEDWAYVNVQRFAIPFLEFLTRECRGLHGGRPKAVTVKQYCTTLAIAIIRYTVAPPSSSVTVGAGMQLLRSGLWAGLQNAGINLVFHYGLDRRRATPIYLGRPELQRMIESVLAASALDGELRLSRIQQILAWLIAFHTGTRPGALACSFPQYRELGLFLKWGDLRLYRVSKYTYKLELTLANLKGSNISWQARQSEYVLGPTDQPENVLSDVANVCVIWAFASNQLDPRFKTLEDVYNDTAYELVFRDRTKPVFVQGHRGGHGVDFDVAALTSTLQGATADVVKAAGLPGGTLYGFRRDAADDYAAKLGREWGSIILGHKRGSVFEEHYSRGTASHDLVRIRVGELAHYNTPQSIARSKLHELNSPAVVGLVQQWVQQGLI